MDFCVVGFGKITFVTIGVFLTVFGVFFVVLVGCGVFRSKFRVFGFEGIVCLLLVGFSLIFYSNCVSLVIGILFNILYNVGKKKKRWGGWWDIKLSFSVNIFLKIFDKFFFVLEDFEKRN